MKRFIGNILMFSVVLFGLSSCELFGLDLQENAEFDDTQINTSIDMTAWEYIKTNPQDFSVLKEAVEYAGLEDEFEIDGRTFLLMNNRALGDDSYSGTYFTMNKIPNSNYDPENPDNGPEFIVPTSWDSYPKEQVVNLIKYHILREPVSIKESMDYKIWFPTLAYEEKGDTALVCTEWVRDRNCAFRFNNFVGSRLTNLTPKISNMKCTNGYIHVFQEWMAPPTKEILESYGVDF